MDVGQVLVVEKWSFCMISIFVYISGFSFLCKTRPIFDMKKKNSNDFE